MSIIRGPDQGQSMAIGRVVRTTVGFFAVAVSTLSASAGPDLIVADSYTCKKWGTSAGVSAYSFSFIYCNIGDEPALVFQGSAVHPVVTTSVYRMMNGRLEQIGQGFVFHEYCALQTSICATCTPVDTACVALGPGCSTTTGSSTAGAQQRLGSRRFVNPASGVLTWPIAGFGDLGDVMYKRVQVSNVDLDASIHPGASYFIESRIVATDDGFAGNGLNNATCRPIQVGPMVDGGPILTPSGVAVTRTTAVEAWGLADASVHVSFIDLGDGSERFVLGSKATANGDGTWSYEYALENYSATQGAGSFRVPLNGSAVSAAAFHDVASHSGDPFDSIDWASQPDGSIALEWRTAQPWSENPNGNALRWGSTYSFRLVSSGPPTSGSVTIGLFEPGETAAVSGVAIVPGAVPPACVGDADGDGEVDFTDVTSVLSGWGTPGPMGDADHDGDVDFADVSAVLAHFGGAC
ncbi:MAG: hypothetical protein JNK58_00080 [Phycisphaerae bacterium]|nr:hypothetical protein [Phycisphaerae bacterium]